MKCKASETTTKTNRKEIIRKFVCLSDKEQLETPDAEEQRELLMVGLGETKISIAEEASELEIRDRVLENFPQLQAAGGAGKPVHLFLNGSTFIYSFLFMIIILSF